MIFYTKIKYKMETTLTKTFALKLKKIDLFIPSYICKY
ncbi:hypothetical protein S2E19_02597 [Bacillus mycoides]|nr:hypothetical protein bmyco0001_23070 [Bacillus mycoides DSM 2048]KZE04624.1 hypothetical protein B4117_3725 [Bacillus mycoides]OSY10035.1 hypothetical protein S2E19_02597 [Bacillus mycoides]